MAMPRLSWRDGAPHPATSTHPTFQTELALALTEAQARELAGELVKALAPSGAELKLELSGGWTLYFKLREQGLSRLQLAKPQIDQWVASLHLSPEHSQRLISGLEQLYSSEVDRFRLSELGSLTAIVNFELVIRRVAP
jgi:hypothetical protein